MPIFLLFLLVFICCCYFCSAWIAFPWTLAIWMKFNLRLSFCMNLSPKIFRDNLSRQKFSFWKLINENVRWKRLVWILKYFASFKSEAFDILGNTNTKPSLLKKNENDFCCRICLNQTCKDLSVTKNYVKCPQVNIWTSSRKVPPKTCVFRVEDM